jgi:hypothetical protein
MRQPQLHRTVSDNITYGKMVTWFVTSPPTDNSPQPKEALPTVSQLYLAFLNCLTPRLCSLMVRRWSTVPISLSYTTPLVAPWHGAHFLILYYPIGGGTLYGLPRLQLAC